MSNTPEGWVVQLLERLLAKDSFFSKSLLAVIQRLNEQRLLFVTGICIIILAALLMVFIISPVSPAPYYVTLGVFVFLAVVAIVLASVLPESYLSQGSGRRQTQNAQEDLSMSDIPKECKPLQQQLEEAIETLNILKLQDAKLADSGSRELLYGNTCKPSRIHGIRFGDLLRR